MGLLRLLMALSVVLSHVDMRYQIVGGQSAVQIFYIISGFLIHYVLVDQNAYGTLRNFYASRFWRIYPPYFVCAGAMLIVHVARPTLLEQFSGLLPGTRLFLGLVNLTLVGQDWVMFLKQGANGLQFTSDFQKSGSNLWEFLLLAPSWTLALELMFYALAPFILPSRKLLIGSFIASMAARLIGAELGYNDDPWSYRFFPFELSLFAAGALSCRYLLPVARRTNWGKYAMSLILALVLLDPFLGLPRPVLLAACAIGLPFIFFVNPVDRWLGEVSYPLYLVHWPVVAIFDDHSLSAKAMVMLSLLAAAVVLQLMGPLENWRRRFRNDGRVPAG